MKAACYCMTRNIYGDVIPSLKSLLMNTDVDRVYLIAEDDRVPFSVPDRVSVINVSHQSFFPRTGPNYNSKWTWMAMMRVALPWVLPELDRIVSLDLDTIVHHDASDLWDFDLGGCYLAAVPEPGRSYPDHVYHNMGVAYWNLDALRDGKSEEIVNALNTKHYEFPEQDAVNELCQGKILPLPSVFNANYFTSTIGRLRIRHFAAERGWQSFGLVSQYRDVPWQDVKYQRGR